MEIALEGRRRLGHQFVELNKIRLPLWIEIEKAPKLRQQKSRASPRFRRVFGRSPTIATVFRVRLRWASIKIKAV